MQKIVSSLLHTQMQINNGSLLLTIYKSGSNVCVDVSSLGDSGSTVLVSMVIGRDMRTIMQLFSEWDVNLDPFGSVEEEVSNAVATLVRP